MPTSPNLCTGEPYDVLVVGGGINGAGIARDLAGRGWRVMLVERDDLAAHTSSCSTKLIHGGLRYLEHRAFGLVRKALRERELLLRSAPHIMRPMRFVLPHAPGMRPAWLIRLGLFLYDHLARREVLPGSSSVNLRRHEAGDALQDHFRRGFAYSDGWVDDARLVVLAAMDAAERGACILTGTRCVAARPDAHGWTAQLEDGCGGRRDIRARALVNAAGPWAASFLDHSVATVQGVDSPVRHLRMVKGSHIVVPRCFAHEQAYLFQNTDGRILFAIPYERNFTLIGTTDVAWNQDPQTARADATEVAYLCEQASRYFRVPVRPADVVWSYAGVRPLVDEGPGPAAAASRDYQLHTHTGCAAPLLTVLGGKITTFRKLAEDAGTEVGALLGSPRRAWTAGAALPGGDLSAWIGPARRPDRDFERFVQVLGQRHAWLPPALAWRYARAYGSRVGRIIGDAKHLGALGEEIAPGLHTAELIYLRDHEWARDAADVLWRRSKLGLHYSPAQRAAVAHWIQENY